MDRATFQILRRGGWHPGRNVDSKGVIQFLTDRGFVLNHKIRSFIEEFGQLEFETMNPYQNDSVNLHHTMISKAIGSLTVNDFKIFEEKFGEKLVPVGELYNRYLFLFMSHSGNMYTDLGLLGENPGSTFHNAFSRKIKKTLSRISLEEPSKESCQNICVVTDKSMPEDMYKVEEIQREDILEDIKFAGTSSLFDYNPLFFPKRFFLQPQKFKEYYKFGLTDSGIDRVILENPGMIKEENVEMIRGEMAKLRRSIVRVKEEAKKKEAKAFDGSESFELWPIEYCAEIWAARNAILQGVKFENIAFSLFRVSDKSLLPVCNNCKGVFQEQYRGKEGLFAY
jgi:hypothetical protein